MGTSIASDICHPTMDFTTTSEIDLLDYIQISYFDIGLKVLSDENQGGAKVVSIASSFFTV
jgi:hypothetical protein